MIRTRYLESLCKFATPEDIAGGIAFYPECKRAITDLAFQYGFTDAASVGAFAALSPRSPLDGNFRSLASCMSGIASGAPEESVRVMGFHRGRRAAWRILSGEADFADICSGPKITAFRHNLLFPETSERVTIDGHILALMLGDHSLTMYDAMMASRKAVPGTDAQRYAKIEAAFLKFVRKVRVADWSVPAYQAVLWNMRRRLAGFEPVTIPRKVEPYEPAHA